MPEINLGVDYDDVKHLDEFPVVPNGTYPFTVKSAEETVTGPNSKVQGRPMVKWGLEIVNPETNSPLELPYYTVLPWNPPGEDSVDVSGVGMLVSLYKGVGTTWEGGTINTDQVLGRAGMVKVSQQPRRTRNDAGEWVNDPSGKKINNVEGFEY